MCGAVSQNSLKPWRYITWPVVKSRIWPTICGTQSWSTKYSPHCPTRYILSSISIIPSTMHYTATTPLLSSAAVWNSVSFCTAHTLLFVLLSNTTSILIFTKQYRNQGTSFEHTPVKRHTRNHFCADSCVLKCYDRWQHLSNCKYCHLSDNDTNT